MERKRDKFAKLRSKKCSKIDVPASQITNYFNPRISATINGPSSSETITIEDSSDSNQNEISSSAESCKISQKDPPKATTNKQASSQSSKEIVKNETNRSKKRNSSVEKKGPKRKVSKLNDEEMFSQLLVQQSMAEYVNPDDLQLALALSRSITDTKRESSTVSPDKDNSNAFQAVKPSIKQTLEEYGFKSGSELNRNVKNFLGSERERKGFRKMSLLLHRNPKKQNRLYNDRINNLLEKSENDWESSCGKSSYHFKITSQDLLQCLNKTNDVMAINSNPEPLAKIYSLYYKGDLVEHSNAKVTALLRNWDDIAGREMSPERIKIDQEDRKSISDEDEEMLPETVSNRRSMTPDIFGSDDEISPMKSQERLEEETSPVAQLHLTKTSSKAWLEDPAQQLESVIVIDSDEELEINQSINKIVNITTDLNDSKQLKEKSKSEGFIMSMNQINSDWILPDLEMELEKDSDKNFNSSPVPKPNITTLLTGEIIVEPPEEEIDQEVKFVSESLKNQDICVVKRKLVTPPPNFNAMGSEEIQEQLKKYGLKAIKGRKAITLLEHIYNQLHPFIEVEDEMYALKCKYGLIDSQDEQKSQKSSQDSASIPEAKVEYLDIVCKDHFLGDVEARKCFLPSSIRKKLPTCALPLHIAFYNYLQVNKDLHEKILQYQPVSLEEIQEHFKGIGIKYDNNDLIEFLDKICVTFRGLGRPQVRARKKNCKRAPKSPMKSNAPAS